MVIKRIGFHYYLCTKLHTAVQPLVLKSFNAIAQFESASSVLRTYLGNRPVDDSQTHRYTLEWHKCCRQASFETRAKAKFYEIGVVRQLSYFQFTYHRQAPFQHRILRLPARDWAVGTTEHQARFATPLCVHSRRLTFRYLVYITLLRLHGLVACHFRLRDVTQIQSVDFCQTKSKLVRKIRRVSDSLE